LLQEKPKQLLKKHRRLFTVSAYNYALGNPSNLVDPNGTVVCGGVCLTIAGATVGGAAVGAATEYFFDDDASLKEIGISAAKGGLIGLGSAGGGFLGAAIGGAVGETGEGYFQGQSLSATALEATGSAAGAALGGAVGRQLGRIAQSAGVSQKVFGQIQKLAGSSRAKQLASALDDSKFLEEAGKTFLSSFSGKSGGVPSDVAIQGIGAAVLIAVGLEEEAKRQLNRLPQGGASGYE
jgi:hypothetical protein